jgi:hypothetical protein
MELAQAEFVSPTTAKTLQQFGWVTGDPIPLILGETLVKWRENIPKSSDTSVLVAIADLSADQVAEIKNMLVDAQDFKAKKSEENALEEKCSRMKPSVANEYRRLHANKSGSGAEEDKPPPPPPATGAQIVDDREAVASGPQASAQAQAGGKNPALLSQAPVNCPRCGWDVTVPHEVKITDNDKEDFLSSVLGGHRFKKKYELFGGKMCVHFRSLTSRENEAVYKQISLDQGNDIITTKAQWLVRLLDYRMVCALEKITDGAGKELANCSELDLSTGDKDQTAILPRYDEMNNSTLAQEAVRRLVGQHLREFFRLTEALESAALEPNFWNGIE